MDVVSHRELRNNSAQVLRRVVDGETVTVTNNGQPVARLSPVALNTLDELTAGGQGRRPRHDVSTLRDVVRRRSAMSSEQILADLRGDR